MDNMLVFTLLFPALMGICLYQYRKELLYLAKAKLVTEIHSYDLLITIPSARDHFVQRQTIRDTWWRSVEINDSLRERVKLKFILGSEDCVVPLENRLDEYDCEPWTPEPISRNSEYLAVRPTPKNDITDAYGRNYGQQYVTFKVAQSVLLTKLGIHKQSIMEGARVSLLDAVSQKQIVSVQFSPDSHGDIKEGFAYKPVDTYLLPKGFEGVIIGDNPLSSKGRLPCYQGYEHHSQLVNSTLLHFSTYQGPIDVHYADIYSWKANHMPVVSFVYTTNEFDDVDQAMQMRLKRQSLWDAHLEDVNVKINDEQEHYDDIVIINSMETYRNIPRKMLHAFTWASTSEQFRYLLKADDDCYLDLVRILSELNHLKLTGHSNRMWWGHFRHNWAVEVHGKWAEQVYPAPAYPKFACGVGYVISNDIVRWLSDNADHLHPYQGEDVSMGIWLAAIAPNHVDDPMWQCEHNCISDMYAMPDLNASELRQLWLNIINCGDPCGCD